MIAVVDGFDVVGGESVGGNLMLALRNHHAECVTTK